MDLIVQPATALSGEIELPSSKLHTQLASALAILAGGKSTVESPLRVKDTNVMLKAAEIMGATVKRTQEKWTIWGLGGKPKPAQNFIDAKNSGTALSLLTSIAVLAPTPTVLNGDVQLRSRSMLGLLMGLRYLGADVHSTKPDDSPPFVVFGGGLRGGRVQLSEVEARYLPAVLLPAPYAKKEVELSFGRGKQPFQLESITELMKKARVRVTARKGKISVPTQPYRALNYKVPRELAGAAPFIAAAALTDSRLKLRGVKRVFDRDAAFLQAMKSFGVRLHISGRHVDVEGRQKLRATRLDLSWGPELLPMMAVLACAARGRTLIQNAVEARKMKSDRISAIAHELHRMGARVLERHDGLLIQGPCELKGCGVDGHDDYAVVAALVVAGLLADGKTTIKNGADALGTAYSHFVSTFHGLGADIGYAH
ncbi:MAG: hypothetical protein QMD95_04765 [Candidatus Hodarchaeaceae archaeon]|nr:hypothetical protein [Candidatus Hodarchaeaceae archaeon]